MKKKFKTKETIFTQIGNCSYCGETFWNKPIPKKCTNCKKKKYIVDRTK